MNPKLKVLVFDDTLHHRQAAQLLLGDDYDLTVVSTYDEAQDALVSKTDYSKAWELFPSLLDQTGLKRGFNPYRGDIDAPEADKQKYFAAEKESRELATTYPDFNVVLTDLLVPASRQAQGNEGLKFVGQEMPLGTTIALLALCAGVKKVAVVTDMNHHHHPASAAFDCIDGKPCKLEGINIICTNHVSGVPIDQATGKLVDSGFLTTEAGRAKYPYLNPDSEWSPRTGLVWGKDWKKVLLELTSESKSEE